MLHLLFVRNLSLSTFLKLQILPTHPYRGLAFHPQLSTRYLVAV